MFPLYVLQVVERWLTHPDSHDMRLRRVREVLQHESRPPEGLAVVRAAVTLIENLVYRVGAVSRCYSASCTQKTTMVAVECAALVGRCWS